MPFAGWRPEHEHNAGSHPSYASLSHWRLAIHAGFLRAGTFNVLLSCPREAHSFAARMQIPPAAALTTFSVTGAASATNSFVCTSLFKCTSGNSPQTLNSKEAESSFLDGSLAFLLTGGSLCLHHGEEKHPACQQLSPSTAPHCLASLPSSSLPLHIVKLPTHLGACPGVLVCSQLLLALGPLRKLNQQEVSLKAHHSLYPLNSCHTT